MTEALYYEKKKNGSVRCRLCPHNCLIEKGEKGFCGVRRNDGGTLYALTDSRVISVACDPVEKKPLYHFLPGSQAFSLGGLGCNLICRHCQNHEISQTRDDRAIDSLYTLEPAKIVREALARNCAMIAWTYNEPTIWYEYIKSTSLLARKAGIKTVLITNGVINREPLEELLPLIDAYRVDIKGFSNEFYRDLTGFPFLEIVKKSIETAYAQGVHIELVTNIIPGMNDREEEIDQLISWIKTGLSPAVPWHVTAYHPAYKMNRQATQASSLEKIRNRGLEAGLKHIYLGNVYSDSGSDTFCPSCGSTLIRRTGMAIRENIMEKDCCPQCGHKLEMFQYV
ncbi:AmmeMemoRadiSam system radical SAM enzyme [Spirochaeta isovalerica]|uniref:Pyruvate formate lyase activating enzyme n=1 Tax=Spirochaeta isovalerica TaxID=150 RepID=A0A841RBW8_9SPIO|nr:AmmeMemoRadiSam system radical SAM enzyme [Spirochaeta isovalerica]MBB6480861.1 pyruvate formate lyase activating enzyme [Spirochaeta isovalerica]